MASSFLRLTGLALKTKYICYNTPMNEKYLEQKLTLYRNLITIFWTSSFILGGGLYSIAFKLNHWILVFIFGTGLVFEIAVFSIAIILIIRCKELVKKLKEFK